RGGGAVRLRVHAHDLLHRGGRKSVECLVLRARGRVRTGDCQGAGSDLGFRRRGLGLTLGGRGLRLGGPGLRLRGPGRSLGGLAPLIAHPPGLHCWATWCEPGREELPSLLRFRDALEKDKEGRVILVSVEDENAGPGIAKFAKSVGLDLRSYRAPKGGLADRV